MKFIAAIPLLLLFASCAPATASAPPAARPDNFAFDFQNFACGMHPLYELDTANGTLSRTPLDSKETKTVAFRITDDELDQVYKKVIAVQFFALPPVFEIPIEQTEGYLAPRAQYRLSVTSGDLAHTVKWIDERVAKPAYTKADELRELMRLIEDIYTLRHEYQQLLPVGPMCL